ncbi:hypothetical protein [Alkalihalobacillus trypoxylicola]|uniref:hypothetical protein n=1 Tax=Alkalihalobacillus trypoxylicola TaxID=519424 RepID=UPI000AD07F25|nr:hypothetical protein [Alkalihalobacillus trypoxylicola]
MNEKYFEVINDSFYMVGQLIMESPKTYLLQFNLSPKLGGLHKVMFFKEEVREFSMV